MVHREFITDKVTNDKSKNPAALNYRACFEPIFSEVFFEDLSGATPIVAPWDQKQHYGCRASWHMGSLLLSEVMHTEKFEPSESRTRSQGRILLWHLPMWHVVCRRLYQILGILYLMGAVIPRFDCPVTWDLDILPFWQVVDSWGSSNMFRYVQNW